MVPNRLINNTAKREFYIINIFSESICFRIFEFEVKKIEHMCCHLIVCSYLSWLLKEYNTIGRKKLNMKISNPVT